MANTVSWPQIADHSAMPEFMRKNEDRLWQLYIRGEKTDERDWKVASPFGSFENRMVLHPNGSPNFNRPEARERPNIHIGAFFTKHGRVYVGVLHQERPHADHPKHPGEKNDPIVLATHPMGFCKDGETIRRAALRELKEEMGVTRVKRVTRPRLPQFNLNGSFVASWMDVVLVEVDPESITPPEYDPEEPIQKAEFVELSELMRRFKKGKHKGAYYRSVVGSFIYFNLLVEHPEWWAALLPKKKAPAATKRKPRRR